jgi:putative restriction endonuclease
VENSAKKGFMENKSRNWSREELIVAINLYCKLPFGKLHRNNPDVVNLSVILNRTPSAVAYKLVNFASLDPSLKARGIKGATNISKLDKQIWEEFYHNWEELPYESEVLLSKISKAPTIIDTFESTEDEYKEGKTREQTLRVRVNQSFFRSSILAAYNSTCCITGLSIPELLTASHIRPWAIDEKNRLNPRNGLLLNSLHDRAFENGLISITPEYKILVSSKLKRQIKNENLKTYFLGFEGENIILPSRFLPDPIFLKYHNEERFQL